MLQKKSVSVTALEKMQKIRLDVGCGEKRQPGFIGIDKRKTSQVDIVHDCEIFPWPIPDNCCELIVVSHLIEHIKPWLQIDFMNEIWRCMSKGGLLLLSTPYAGSMGYWQDPTHCSAWTDATIMYFVQGNPLYDIYKPKPWKIEQLAYDKNKNIEVAFRKE